MKQTSLTDGFEKYRKKTRKVRFLDDIRNCEQLEKSLPVVGVREIQFDTALVGIVCGEVERGVCNDRLTRSSYRTAGRLDEDHIGTQIRQVAPTGFPFAIAQIEHTQAGERKPFGVC